MDCVMEVLQNYNIIEIEKSTNKKDSKINKFFLKVELTDLHKAMQDLYAENRGESPVK